MAASGYVGPPEGRRHVTTAPFGDYARLAARFLAFVARPLRAHTLADLQAYADRLLGAPATRIRTLAAAKSQLSFGQRLGYLPMNIGAALKLPPRKDTLAERILTAADVVRILALEHDRRNHALLRRSCKPPTSCTRNHVGAARTGNASQDIRALRRTIQESRKRHGVERVAGVRIGEPRYGVDYW